MICLKTLSLLALAALGANASPSSRRAAASAESSLKARQTCNLKPDTSGLNCGSNGYVSDPKGNLGFPEFRATPGECMDLCHQTLACNFVLWREGLCQPYAGTLEDAGWFSVPDSLSTWYDNACFQCCKS